MADIERWWDLRWQRRNILTSNTNADIHTSGVHFVRLEADLSSLITQGFVDPHYTDIRILCQKPTHFVNIPYYIASGCSPERIYFAIQADIPAHINMGSMARPERYYMYYDNKSSPEVLKPNSYININFPKAPYSCHPDGYTTAYGKFRDKYFFRFNDDPVTGAATFKDETNHGVGTSKDHEGISKGHSGVLDQSVYFDGYIDNPSPPLSGSYIEVSPNTHYKWDKPSGDYSIDFWVRLDYPNSNLTYQEIFYRYPNPTDYLEWMPHCSINFNKTNQNGKLYTYCLYSSARFLMQYESSMLATSGIWHHYRVAYRTGGDYFISRIRIYHNGQDVSYDKTTAGEPWAENTAYYADDPSPIFIGWPYRNSPSKTDYCLKGWLEQLRYSTFVYPAISGLSTQYECPPAWVNTQLIADLGDVAISHEASEAIGGYVISATPTGPLSGIIGGYAYCLNGSSDVIGGYLFAVSATTSGVIGGYLFSAIQTSGVIGGYSLGSLGDVGLQYIEGLNRVLVKANSDSTYRQQFGTDATFALYAQNNNQFDSKISINKETVEDFDALLNIIKIQRNPHIEVISESNTYNGILPCTYSIIASGNAFSYKNIPYTSGIHSVAFIWGDGTYTNLPNTTTSGSVWGASHIYSSSGLYKPLIIIKDKYGRTGSVNTDINLASGVAYPYISLSGTPRVGTTPPNLTVNFTATLSGVVGAYTIYWDFGNGIQYYNNSLTQIAYYALPGDYTPIVRVQDSRRVKVADSLKLGYNI